MSSFVYTVLSGAAPHVPIEYLDNESAGATFSGANTSFEAATHWSRGDTSKNPSRARAGDFMVAKYQSPLVQLPHEGYSTLVRGTATEFARAQGDWDAHKRLNDKYQLALANLPGKLSPRAIEEPNIWVNHNSPGRQRRLGRGGGWR